MTALDNPAFFGQSSERPADFAPDLGVELEEDQ
jgi:hypothetical protein